VISRLLAIITSGYRRGSLSKPLDDPQSEPSSHPPPICPRQLRSMCSEKRAIAVFQLQSNRVGALAKIASDFYAALRLVHRSRFLILPIRYHRE